MSTRKQFVEEMRLPNNSCNYTVDEKAEWYRAYAEVYLLICHCDEEGIGNLIPESFMNFLKDHMDPRWGGNLDFSKSMHDMQLLKKTRIILSLVYRDFICSEEKRKQLIDKDKAEAEKMRMVYKDESLRALFNF